MKKLNFKQINFIVFLFITTLGLNISVLSAQSKHVTRKGKATFFSKAPVENIESTNRQVLSILDAAKGEIAVSMLMKAFKFEKALMEEHFNENYIESAKYPKASFKGKIQNLNTIDFKKDGKYPATIKGTMTMHGKTNEVTAKGTITVRNKQISADSKFKLNIKDYDIKIPKLLTENIAEVVDVTVHFDYEAQK